MLAKTWNPTRARYDVTFDLPSELDIEEAAVVGEFNDWDESADPMHKGDDGRWSTTVSLEPGRSYRFRYHLGNGRWENDWNADDYVDNDFGGSDSVVQLPDAPSEPPVVKSAAKKSSAKKSAAKSTAKKSAAKKAAPKKAAAKKAAAKKAGANKSAAKKSARRSSEG